MRLDKVVAPTDLSDRSRTGLAYAVSLSRDARAELVIVHVAGDLRAWEFLADEAAYWPTERMLIEAAQGDFNRFVERCLGAPLNRLPGVRGRVQLGGIVAGIIDVAEEEKADLIVLTTRRRKAWRGLFTGSITDRVTREAPCPVLSVTTPLPSRPWRGKSIPRLIGPSWQKEARI